MTDKEKAQAYDEALERARGWKEKYSSIISSDGTMAKDFDSIFPQLAESKDERIRRKMIEHFKSKTKETWCNMPVKDIIAYLEKQKEVELTEEDKKIIPEALIMLCNDIINHRVHTPIRTDEEGARKIKTFLKTINRQPHKTKEEWEKQKEQKPLKVGENAYFDPNTEMWFIKKQQKEPTPAEPELKIPDWVHGGWDDEYMINTVIGRYSLHAEVAKKHGDTHDYNLSKSMENWLRNVVKPLILEKQKELDKMIVVSPEVWDNAISDAFENGKKEGEKQKENPEEPKIAFGDWGDKEKQEAIFTCLKYMRFIKKITNQEYNNLTEWLGSNLVYNLLGNGWYLKHKEQKPIKWTDLTWKDIVELEGIINNVHYDFSAGIGQESFGKEVLERFRNKKDDAEVDACEPKPTEWREKFIADVFEKVGLAKIVREQGNDALTNAVQSAMIELSKVENTEWSEEDEKMLKSIIEDITPVGECPDYPTDEEREYYYSGQDKMNWLKGLSNRFNLQPKQEWSEEDIKKIRSEEYTKGFNDAAFGGKLKEWSVEDEDKIRQIERIAQQAGCTQKLQEEIHDWLKSLRPSWKPSEEQIRLLQYFSKGIDVAFHERHVLDNMIDDLKKLM